VGHFAAPRTFSVETTGEDSVDAGIYTWDIEKNLLFADGALAVLFGLDPEETVKGLPLEAYLARVHAEDRPHLARVISETIIADVPQHDTYRVKGGDGHFRRVAAFGKAFRGPEGTAVLYSGIVVPAQEVANHLLN
jgi:PAS domain-containing protein